MILTGQQTITERLKRLDDMGIDGGTYERLMDRRAASDSFTANSWLRDLQENIDCLFSTTKVVDVSEIARSMAGVFGARIGLIESEAQWLALDHVASELCDQVGIGMPAGRTPVTALLRLRDAGWWRRKLNAALMQVVDQTTRKHGGVSRQASLYVSDAALGLWLERQKANKSVLDRVVMENDMGQRYSLSELSEKSTANPEIKRVEMMTRLRGIEEFSKISGREAAVFVTITAPSKYHCNSKGTLAKKWNGSTPRDVSEYFNALWQRLRAELARQDIQYHGVRVAEPHHDGCPHWHLLVFIAPADLPAFVIATKEYAMGEDGGERGAKKRRVTFEYIDPKKGSAVGYIAKYISKSINGAGIEKDLHGRDAVASSIRVRAWASIWKIRQFQFFGTAAVGVWRELRRVAKVPAESVYMQAHKAADAAEYCAYLQAVAAANLTVYRAECDVDTGEVFAPVNAYGEAVSPPVTGVVASGSAPLITRLFDWFVVLTQKSVAPWTCVSNCTDEVRAVGEHSRAGTAESRRNNDWAEYQGLYHHELHNYESLNYA
jgi:hypothetical protein